MVIKCFYIILTKKNQFVIFGGHESDWEGVEVRVPQTFRLWYL